MSFKQSRRDFLHVGFAGGIGLTLPEFLRIKSAQAEQKYYETKEGTAKSVIFIYLPGGAAHQETWDPKPLAPADYRGAFGAIKTSVPGIEIVDLMPRCASIMDKWSIIRSLHHSNAGHSAGDQILFTGYPPGTDPTTRKCKTSQTLGDLFRIRRRSFWQELFVNSPASAPHQPVKLVANNRIAVDRLVLVMFLKRFVRVGHEGSQSIIPGGKCLIGKTSA